MMGISLAPISVSFRKLNEELIEEGLYSTHISYYYIQLLKLLVLFTTVISLIVYNRCITSIFTLNYLLNYTRIYTIIISLLLTLTEKNTGSK